MSSHLHYICKSLIQNFNTFILHNVQEISYFSLNKALWIFPHIWLQHFKCLYMFFYIKWNLPICLVSGSTWFFGSCPDLLYLNLQDSGGLVSTPGWFWWHAALGNTEAENILYLMNILLFLEMEVVSLFVNSWVHTEMINCMWMSS